jgi:hypothetical protein
MPQPIGISPCFRDLFIPFLNHKIAENFISNQLVSKMLAINSLFICLISLLLLLVSSVSSSALLSQSKQHLTGRRLVVTNVSNAASGGRFGAPSLGMGAANQLAHQQLSQQQIQKQKLASWAEGLARTEQVCKYYICT